MSIAHSTTIQGYQLLKGGARARLAIFRMIAAESVHNLNPHTRLNPNDWRAARSYTLKSYASAYCSGLDQGSNDGEPVWYCHTGEQFRNEQDATEILRNLGHSGYYADIDQDNLIIGIVAQLPHGRYIAGYRSTDSGERVYFPEVFTGEDAQEDAARMSDEHARVYGELCYVDSERFDAAQNLESDIETLLLRLRECIVLRHTACMDYVRAEITELCESIRDKRETLRTDYAGVL